MTLLGRRFTYCLAAAAPVLLSGCATYAKCGFSGCVGDAGITADIESKLHENKAIEDWNIRVQTLDRTVYLYGIVDTNVERAFIIDTAWEEPGVDRVVDSIVIRGNVW